MMTCYRYCRTEYIGSRCTQGLIAVHCRQGARHCRHDCPRTGGRELDRRCACEEAAKGRFHLQVRATPHTPLHPPFFFHHITGCAEVPDFGALRWPVDWLVGRMNVC
jgi:hypothetical protein